MKQPDKLPKPLRREFLHFLEDHPPQAFSNSLRRLLLDYMEKEVSTGLPVYFDRFLWSLSDLFDLLDMAAAHRQQLRDKEGKKQKQKKISKQQL
jgi:hypothetical protein